MPVMVGTTFTVGLVTAAVAAAALLIAARSSDSASELDIEGSSIPGREILPSHPDRSKMQSAPVAIVFNLFSADQEILCFDTAFTP